MKADEARAFAAIAVDVATRGGAIATRGFRHPKTVSHKAHAEIVTEYDLAVENAIRELLAQRTPDASVVAEEAGGDRKGELIWYVDPIDGTTNYAHGHPFWAVSVGLVERGVPVAGAVFAPSLGITWQGWAGGQALRNGEPCHVSTNPSLCDALLATGFPYDRRTSPVNNFAQFVGLKRIALGIRRCGSAALDLCLVADGTYDAYWEMKLRPWDIAAGIAIVLAASGRVTTLDGAHPDVERGELAASNGAIHDHLLRALREASP